MAIEKCHANWSRSIQWPVKVRSNKQVPNQSRLGESVNCPNKEDRLHMARGSNHCQRSDSHQALDDCFHRTHPFWKVPSHLARALSIHGPKLKHWSSASRTTAPESTQLIQLTMTRAVHSSNFERSSFVSKVEKVLVNRNFPFGSIHCAISFRKVGFTIGHHF